MGERSIAHVGVVLGSTQRRWAFLWDVATPEEQAVARTGDGETRPPIARDRPTPRTQHPVMPVPGEAGGDVMGPERGLLVN